MKPHPFAMNPKPITPPARRPGGCDDCHAHQTLTKTGRVTLLTIHHNDTCPSLRARQNRRNTP